MCLFYIGLLQFCTLFWYGGRGVAELCDFRVSSNLNHLARMTNTNIFIYENTKLELQRIWKSLDHKLSSGDMT